MCGIVGAVAARDVPAILKTNSFRIRKQLTAALKILQAKQ